MEHSNSEDADREGDPSADELPETAESDAARGPRDPGTPDPSVASLPGFGNRNGPTDPSVARLPEDDAPGPAFGTPGDPAPRPARRTEGADGGPGPSDGELRVQRTPKGNAGGGTAGGHVFSVSRGGSTKVLNRGNASKGWKHIEGRHVDGTLDQGKRTSFFPVGQRLTRGGTAVTLDDEMSVSDVKTVIEQAVRNGSEDTGDPAEVYVLDSSDHGFDLGDIRVVLGSGEVITAYPVRGPKTPTWDPKNGWENV